MNPLTNVKNITKLNQIELQRGTVDKKSWHDIYKESAWVFIGGLPYGLTEGDILSVFSQYGEIVNINLVRDKKTGKTKGFCFLCYANQKSTILAVDNLNAIKICGRTIRVDHVANYKPPKENEDEDDITKQLKAEGCAPKPLKDIATEEAAEKKKSKKVKKEKKKHKKHKKRDIKQEDFVKVTKVKQEKYDPGYAKYELSGNEKTDKNTQRSESEDSESSSEDSSDCNSSRLYNRESTKFKAAGKDSGMNSNFKRKSNELDRSKVSTFDAKRRRDDSSSEESMKRNKSNRMESKNKISESSMHQSSAHAEKSPDSSDESKRYSSLNHSQKGGHRKKTRDNINNDRSPFKDKHKDHSHKHRRHDSLSSERDTAYKHKVKKRDDHPSSSSNYYDSSGKHKKPEQMYKNGSSSPNSYKYKSKSHRHVSNSSGTERHEK